MKCNWEGYAFGASYIDACCCDGQLGDLDDYEGDDEDGNQLIGVRDEICPQCGGQGEIDEDTPLLGPMAFYRQKARDELNELIDLLADRKTSEEDAQVARADIEKHLDGAFGLINKLEAPKATT